MYNGIKNATIFKERSVIDPTHPAVIVTKELADTRVLAKGAIMAKSAAGLVPMQTATQNIATSDGSTKEFTVTLQNAPVAPGSLRISDGTSTITDDGYGRLRGDGGGTIDYESGKLVATFDTAPSSGATVTATCTNTPVGVLVTDTKEGDTSAPIIIHGTVAASMLLVGDAPASAEEIETLVKNTQIIAI